MELEDHRSPADPEAGERFVVDNDEKAAWVMRKLAALKKRQDEIDSVAKQEIAHIENWHLVESGKMVADMNFFSHILTEYARAEREANGRKSISLPAGTVTSRASSERIDFADVDAFLAWATPNAPSLIQTRREPDKASVKQALTIHDGKVIDPTTGEIVPGLEVKQAEVTYTVKPN